MAELKGNRSASSGSDITLSYSGGSSGLNSPQEFGIDCNDMFLDTKDASIAHNEHRTGWGWPLAAIRYSTIEDSINNERAALGSDDTAEKLNSDNIFLSRKAEVAELELQSLRKQIAKESKRGQDLMKEVASLKEERDSFKEECEKLKASQKHTQLNVRNKLNYEGNPWALLEELRQELNHEKNLNANLRLQLQKTQDSNSELILAVQDLEQILEKCSREDLQFSINPSSGIISEEGKRKSIDDDEEQKALEELVNQQSDAKEVYMLEQKIMDLCSEIEMYRRDKDELEMQMEQLALDYEILKQENHSMSCKLDQSHLRQQLKLQYECSGSYATIHELENQVEKLEKELNDRSNELSDSLATIKALEKEKQAEEAIRLEKLELENQIEMLQREFDKQTKEFSNALDTIKKRESQIQSLEKELSRNAKGSDSNLEAITRAKEEQEQRAIRAEEALRLTRWKNANLASRLQDEFKRLATEMQSTFEANERVATKAMAEASQLRLTNNHLEESLQQARAEIQSVKENYEAQLKLKSSELDAQRETENQVRQSFSDELSMLRAEVDRLTSDTASLAACIEQGEELQAELGQVKALVKERDLLIDSIKKEAEKSMEELNVTRCLNDEKDLALKNLQSEMDSIRAQCEELRHSLLEDELQKDKLSKQVLQTKAELKKKNDEKDLALKNLQSEMDSIRAQCEELRHSLLEDELQKDKLTKQVLQMKAELKKKDDAVADMERKLKVIAAEKTKASSKPNKNEPPSRGSKEAASLRVKIKLLEGQMKRKETDMETSANAFLEKERNLQNKIEELERRLQELNQRSMVYYEDDDKKVDDNAEEIHRLAENGNETPTNAQEASNINSGHKENPNNDASIKEMASLREKNTSMETELKELRDRYSEISLKFAEVEGEREQLVMALRSIKNTKKG